MARRAPPPFAVPRLAALGLWLWAGLAACAEPDKAAPALTASASHLVDQAGDWAILGAPVLAGVVLAGVALAALFLRRRRKRAAEVPQSAPSVEPDGAASSRRQPDASLAELPVLLALDAGDTSASRSSGGRALNRFLAHLEDGARFQPRLVGFVASGAALRGRALARIAEAAWRNDRDVAVIDATGGEAEALIEALDARIGGRGGGDRLGAGARIEMMDVADLTADGLPSRPKAVRRALEAVASRFDLVLVDLPTRELGLGASPALLAALDEVIVVQADGEADGDAAGWMAAEARGAAPLVGRIVVAGEAATRVKRAA